MKMVADENLALLDELFATSGELVRAPGRKLTRDMLMDADVLLVRSVTRVNAELLEGTPVRFVGSATIGQDHLDLDWLRAKGIEVVTAPGCNAVSVTEYVLSALCALRGRGKFDWEGRTYGVVGLGNVGGRLAQTLSGMGLTVIGCDPFRDRPGIERVSLNELLDCADVVSLHTPLTTDGPYPTRHLLNSRNMPQMRPGVVLINTGRGAVIDNLALLSCIQQGKIHPAGLVLDVWENEPEILIALAALTDIATPHIAGYSLEGKWRGSFQIAAALRQFAGGPPPIDWTLLMSVPGTPVLANAAGNDWDLLAEWLRAVYPIENDDAALRDVLRRPQPERMTGFDRLRREYPVRREIASCAVDPHASLSARLRAAGFHY